MNNEKILPPTISAEDFSNALDDFRRIVGDEYVIDESQRLNPYNKVMSPIDKEAHSCSAVVMPESTEHVQEILAVCNKYNMPVWPVSTGRNFGYGSATANTRGQIIMELRRMNKILEVDAELGTVLIEPGVTYKQLRDHLDEQGIDLWLDFPAPGPLVSPLSNTLERGGGQTPYGDHYANSCGMEVVLADGTTLRTGLGGVENSTSWQHFKYGYGPSLDGIFTQSNFGVVTKMGLWLMHKPPAHRTFIVMWPNDDDVVKAVDTIRPLRLDGTIGNFGTLLNAALALGAQVQKKELYTGSGAVPDEILFEAAQQRGVSPWMYTFSLYGRQEIIDINSKIVTEAFEKSGALVVPDIYDALQSSVLSLDTFSLLNWSSGGGLAWFSPVCPNRGSDMRTQHILAKNIMADHGLDFMTGATINGRALENVMPIVYDRTSEEETQRVHQCFEQLVTQFAANGYGLYRTGTGFMDLAASVHGEVNLDVNRRIKRALDPQGIIAPGKSGIYI